MLMLDVRLVISYYARECSKCNMGPQLTTSPALVFEREQAWTNFAGIRCLMLAVEANWVGRDAILMTGYNSLCYVASTIVP